MFSVKMNKKKYITLDKKKRHITQTVVNGVRNDIITPKRDTL